MNKRNVCTVLALLASAVFTALYFLIFGNLNPQPPADQEVVVQTNTNEKLEECTLQWIQLGIFKMESSYRDLVSECETLNLNPVIVSMGDKAVLVVAVTSSSEDFARMLNQVKEMDVEYMVKNQFFEQQEALQMIVNGLYKEVLEGYVYLV